MIIMLDVPDSDLACQFCRRPPAVAARFTGAVWEFLCAACTDRERRRGGPPRPYAVS
ncbi:hypothetical protein GA0115244_104411 [Streptomyces sp. DvalAA-19]|nr:hypothetical protein GA0115244_104411 [Streptomyces sp. DvalAA-19]